MNNEPQSNQRIAHILSTLSTYRMLWIAPMVLGVILSAAYVLVLRQEAWSAKQALIVRDDLLGQSFKPGRFESIESMKSAQETILEIARKPQVIHNALEKLGPVSKGLFGMGLRGWPSEEIIEDVQGSITFTAPNGAEFGKTEVIVLNTKASTRERSREFIELLLSEIILKVDEVRSLRLQSMEVELLQARDAALMALQDSKARLRVMDQKLGVDVGAMSAINDAQSSGGDTIKRDISQIRLEKRQVETNLESLRRSLAMLITAKENPDRILNISGDLGKSQPTLDALKKEVVKTQKDLAIMAGKYNSIHPDVMNAKNAIQAMQQTIYLELDSSMRGLQNDIAVADKKLERLNYEMENLDGRLISLSSKRADSLTLIADLKTRTEIANRAQSDLSEIQGLSLAKNADLLTRVDEPQVSTKPDGLGKKATIFAGGLGGLMLGLGLIMLIAPPIGEDEEALLAGRAGSLDRFFDSKAFEKVVVNASAAASAAAAAAAATAVQSASKAKDYFMSSRTDRKETESEDNQHAPVESNRATEDPAPAPQTVPVEVTGVVTPAVSFASPEPAPVAVMPVAPSPVEPSPIEKPSPIEPSAGGMSMDAKSMESMAASQLAALQLAALKSRPAKQPTDETPALEPPVDETPALEPSVDETPAIEPPVDETPALELLVDETPALEPPVDETPALELPVDETPALELPVDETPATNPVSVVDQAFEVEIEETPTATSAIQEWVTTDPAPAQPEQLDQVPEQLDQVPEQLDQVPDQPQELAPPVADHEERPAVIIVSPVQQEPGTSIDEPKEPIPQFRNEAETIQLDNGDAAKEPVTQVREEAETIQIDSLAELMRRDPNVRPVDLARSEEMEAAFVRIIPKTKEPSGDGQDSPQADPPRQENPFFKDKPGSKPGDDRSSDEAVPDQIKKLNESISRFTKKRPKKGPSDES